MEDKQRVIEGVGEEGLIYKHLSNLFMKMKSVRVSKKSIEKINRFKDSMRLRGVEFTQIEIISEAIRFAHKYSRSFRRNLGLFSI